MYWIESNILDVKYFELVSLGLTYPYTSIVTIGVQSLKDTASPVIASL